MLVSFFIGSTVVLSQTREAILVDPPGIIARLLDSEEPPMVSVSLTDQATDGCWTNLGEARQYATDTLHNLGFRTGDGGGFVFSVNVFSTRTGSGHCFGYLKVSLDAYVQGGFRRSLVNRTMIFAGERSSNIQVLDVIGELGRAMRADSMKE